MRLTLISNVLCLCLTVSTTVSFAQNFQTLKVNEFEKRLDSCSPCQLIDVRTSEEYRKGHLQIARNLDFKEKSFSELLSLLNKERPVYVYSRTGTISEKAATKMIELGFVEVYVLDGGITAWKNAGKPVLSELASATKDKFTSGDLKDIINSDSVVLVDFYATWCVPCMKMMPDIDSIAKEFKGKAVITSINIDYAKALTKELNIREIPVVNIYKSGELAETYAGYLPQRELRKTLNKLLSKKK